MGKYRRVENRVINMPCFQALFLAIWADSGFVICDSSRASSSPECNCTFCSGAFILQYCNTMEYFPIRIWIWLWSFGIGIGIGFGLGLALGLGLELASASALPLPWSWDSPWALVVTVFCRLKRRSYSSNSPFIVLDSRFQSGHAMIRNHCYGSHTKMLSLVSFSTRLLPMPNPVAERNATSCSRRRPLRWTEKKWWTSAGAIC